MEEGSCNQVPARLGIHFSRGHLCHVHFHEGRNTSKVSWQPYFRQPASLVQHAGTPQYIPGIGMDATASQAHGNSVCLVLKGEGGPLRIAYISSLTFWEVPLATGRCAGPLGPPEALSPKA